jgi:hypothetical protein
LRGVGEREGAEWVVRGWGQGGEMTQALYAHMNNKREKKSLPKQYIKWPTSNHNTTNLFQNTYLFIQYFNKKASCKMLSLNILGWLRYEFDRPETKVENLPANVSRF